MVSRGLRKSHAVAKGLDTALAMASGTEGKGAKGQQRDDDEGATEGKIAVKIARVVVVIVIVLILVVVVGVMLIVILVVV